MKARPPVNTDRRVVGSRAELEAALREQMAREDLEVIQLGEGEDRIIVAGPSTRHCGDCSYCCYAAGINELKKPPMVRCSLLAKRPGRGCSVYRKPGIFPKSCGDFVCAWLIGNFDNRYRPDKIGAYVSFFLLEEGFYAIVQCETRRLDKKRLGELVAILHRQVPEVRILYDDRTGTVLRWGEPPLQVLLMPRAPDEYEELVLLIPDEE